jgi:hypothetical protein
VNLEELKTYLDGWALISGNPDEAVDIMIAATDPEVRYSDVNSPNVHVGHAGIRRMGEITRGKYAGTTVTYDSVLFDGRNFSLRWVMRGPLPDGKQFEYHGASGGVVGGEHGKVIEQTDYWSRASVHA